jgi:hypothetical protein
MLQMVDACCVVPVVFPNCAANKSIREKWLCTVKGVGGGGTHGFRALNSNHFLVCQGWGGGGESCLNKTLQVFVDINRLKLANYGLRGIICAEGTGTTVIPYQLWCCQD